MIAFVRETVRACVSAICCLALAACATVDSFGPRAYNFNVQLARANRAQTIANIVRAAYGEPLQFSTVSTATGQASGQLSVGSSLPFWGVRGTSAQLSLTPGVQVSGGPSFSVANQNTQEFLRGIITPIKPEMIGAYVGAGFPRIVVLSLLEQSLEFDVGTDHHQYVNDPSNTTQFNTFMSILNGLVDNGLSFKLVDNQTPVGPPLSQQDVLRSKLLPSLEGTASPPLNLKEYNVSADDGLTKQQNDALTATGVSTFYRLVKAEKKIQYCFNLDYSVTAVPLLAHEPKGTEPEAAIVTPPERRFTISIPDGFLCKNIKDSTKAGDLTLTSTKSSDIRALKLTERSVRQVYTYLGFLTRDEINGGQASADDLHLFTDLCVRIFAVSPTGVASGSYFSEVTHDSESDNPACVGAKLYDYSEESLSIVSELTALYSSAKDLPTPNIIPFFTP